MHTAEPLIREPRFFEVEIITGKLKACKSPLILQIAAQMIQARSNMLFSKIRKLIDSVWNTEELPQQRKESVIVPIYKKGDKTDCSNYRGISLLPTIKILYVTFFSRG
jgi:hypothetical protein